MKKLMALFIIACLLITSFVACNEGQTDENNQNILQTDNSESGGQNSVNEEIEIRLATPWTPGAIEGASDQIAALIEQFEEDYPYVTIVHDSLSTNDLRTKLTVEMASGNPPDVSWCPTNYAREFIKDDLIIDWSDVINDPTHPEFKEWFSEATIASLTEKDGTILLAPQEGSIDALYYNKEMFEKYGWDTPETWAELMSLIPQIKEAGIVPIVTGGKDSRFAWFASALLVRSTGIDNFKSLCLGDDMTNWNDDELGFTDAVAKFKELVDAGAYPNGVLGMSATEADQMFGTEQAAMYYEGAWKPNNFISAGGEGFIEKVGRLDFPEMTDSMNGDADTRVGGAIVGFFVSTKMEDTKKELCIELVKRISSPDFNIPIMEKGGFVYAGNADYNESEISDVMIDLIEAYRSAKSFIPSMDCIAPPAVDLAIKNSAFPGIITGEYDVGQAVAEVQKAAEDYAASLSE